MSRYYHIAIAEWGVLQNYVQKSALYRLADHCDVPHPRTFNPSSTEECVEVADEVKYPCIVKPAYSHELVSAFDAKLFHDNQKEELLHQFQQCANAKI
ncbi:MAG: hypothetical protein AAGC68_03995 [Verrucomicrobiota bacterium]